MAGTSRSECVLPARRFSSASSRLWSARPTLAASDDVSIPSASIHWLHFPGGGRRPSGGGRGAFLEESGKTLRPAPSPEPEPQGGVVQLFPAAIGSFFESNHFGEQLELFLTVHREPHLQALPDLELPRRLQEDAAFADVQSLADLRADGGLVLQVYLDGGRRDRHPARPTLLLVVDRDQVPARALGAVERLVGAREQRLGRLGVLG